MEKPIARHAIGFCFFSFRSRYLFEVFVVFVLSSIAESDRDQFVRPLRLGISEISCLSGFTLLRVLVRLDKE